MLSELKRPLPQFRTSEHDLDSAYTRAWLAVVLIYRGRWREGAALAVEILSGDAAAVTRITANVALGRVRARRGDPGVDRVLDEALALARPMLICGALPPRDASDTRAGSHALNSARAQ